MRLSTFLLIAGLLALAFGVCFCLAPAAALAPYGATTDPVGLLMTRFFGVALVEFGLVLVLVRNVAEPAARRAIVLGGLVGSGLGLIVALQAQLGGLVNALGWSSVAIYALLLLGYGSFVFGRGQA